jgi:broad specificity phosphatase PhoE
MLTPKGRQQCTDKEELVNQIDFEVVYVSPMRRTLESAFILFKEHPNFQKIKFVLLPVARESFSFSAGD